MKTFIFVGTVLAVVVALLGFTANWSSDAQVMPTDQAIADHPAKQVDNAIALEQAVWTDVTSTRAVPIRLRGVAEPSRVQTDNPGRVQQGGHNPRDWVYAALTQPGPTFNTC